MTTEKPTDILPKLPTEMATEKSTKNARKPKIDSLQMKREAEPNSVSNQREITMTILNHDYTATEQRLQSTIDLRMKSLTAQ
jgi:hypothetical protein